MGRYNGETYAVPLEKGGFNHNKNIDTISPVDHVHPTRNIWLNEGGIRKRGGTTPIDTGTMDDAEVVGVFDYTLASSTQFIVRATNNGKLWKDEDTTIKTGLTADKKVHMMQWGDELFFNNGANAPTVWDGAAAETVDLTAGVKAQGTITMAGIAVADETFVIDSQTFTWKAARGTTGEVTIGASASEAVTNIVTAITADLTTVTAVDGTGDTVVVTAASYGTAGNSIVFTEASTNMSVDGSGTMGTTTAGVDDQMPSDWTGSNYPKQMIAHGRGNSLRNWAMGCPSTPKTIYVTADGTPKDFSDANVLTFHIETGDGFGVVGGIDFGNRLILFSRTKSFVINDDDTNTDNWGYTESQWEGGAAHHRLIVRTPNDIVCMMENGEIYSVTAAENYGDYRAASLTRPSFMHEWIKTYIDLSYIDDFHAIYDPILRAVKIFMVRIGETEVDTCLTYFIDRPPDKAWVILGNENFESGYSALCAAVVRQSVGVWKIYTGSYNGQIWKLGEVNRNDNSEAYVARIKTPDMSFDNVRETKRYDNLRVVSVSEGSCSATMTWWVDGTLIDSENLDFAEGGGLLGSFVLGTDALGGPNVLEVSTKLGLLGKRIQVEAKSSTANEDFFLSQFLVDFKPLGKQP